jgi:hypothetical protein
LEVPTCNCHYFSSIKIPCQHIGSAFWYLWANPAVCTSLQRRLF